MDNIIGYIDMVYIKWGKFWIFFKGELGFF